MSETTVVYSIQRTYILKHVLTPEREIVTCDQRIDIPMIEPLMDIKAVVYSDKFSKIIPCIELAGNFLPEFNLEFETNEGVTVLPLKIDDGSHNPLENPYLHPRYVLVLPRGATGVKSCKLIHKATGKEAQHNFTFGILPPPYNYDNALFGHLSYRAKSNYDKITDLEKIIDQLKLTTKTQTFTTIIIPRTNRKITTDITHGALFYNTGFNYPLSSEPTTHHPKITLSGGGRDQVYTLSLNKTKNAVSIDLFTGMITVYDDVTGEIMQQFKLALPSQGFETLSFEHFADIDDSLLTVIPKGANVS